MTTNAVEPLRRGRRRRPPPPSASRNRRATAAVERSCARDRPRGAELTAPTRAAGGADRCRREVSSPCGARTCAARGACLARRRPPPGCAARDLASASDGRSRPRAVAAPALGPGAASAGFRLASARGIDTQSRGSALHRTRPRALSARRARATSRTRRISARAPLPLASREARVRARRVARAASILFECRGSANAPARITTRVSMPLESKRMSSLLRSERRNLGEPTRIPASSRRPPRLRSAAARRDSRHLSSDSRRALFRPPGCALQSEARESPARRERSSRARARRSLVVDVAPTRAAGGAAPWFAYGRRGGVAVPPPPLVARRGSRLSANVADAGDPLVRFVDTSGRFVLDPRGSSRSSGSIRVIERPEVRPAVIRFASFAPFSPFPDAEAASWPRAPRARFARLQRLRRARRGVEEQAALAVRDARDVANRVLRHRAARPAEHAGQERQAKKRQLARRQDRGPSRTLPLAQRIRRRRHLARARSASAGAIAARTSGTAASRRSRTKNGASSRMPRRLAERGVVRGRDGERARQRHLSVRRSSMREAAARRPIVGPTRQPRARSTPFSSSPVYVSKPATCMPSRSSRP